jgi:hypothetical protein
LYLIFCVMVGFFNNCLNFMAYRSYKFESYIFKLVKRLRDNV